MARLLHAEGREPSDLIGPRAEEVLKVCLQSFDGERLRMLLGRGFLLSHGRPTLPLNQQRPVRRVQHGVKITRDVLGPEHPRAFALSRSGDGRQQHRGFAEAPREAQPRLAGWFEEVFDADQVRLQASGGAAALQLLWTATNEPCDRSRRRIDQHHGDEAFQAPVHDRQDWFGALRHPCRSIDLEAEKTARMPHCVSEIGVQPP